MTNLNLIVVLRMNIVQRYSRMFTLLYCTAANREDLCSGNQVRSHLRSSFRRFASTRTADRRTGKKYTRYGVSEAVVVVWETKVALSSVGLVDFREKRRLTCSLVGF